ncbi:MAG: Efflux ABC transporter, ATP-binding protein, partial [uncultured Frankineae bacterium]
DRRARRGAHGRHPSGGRRRRRRHLRVDQALSQRPGGRRRPRAGRATRQRHGVPGPQRVGQDDHHPHAAGPGDPDQRAGAAARRTHPAGQRTGPPPRRGARGGTGVPPVPLGPRQPRPARRRRPHRRPAHQPHADRHRPRAGGAGSRRDQALPHLLARHEAAARARRRAAAPARAVRAGRAHQRARPAGDPGGPHAGARAGGGRLHRARLLPPAGRDRADLRPGDGHARRSGRRRRHPAGAVAARPTVRGRRDPCAGGRRQRAAPARGQLRRPRPGRAAAVRRPARRPGRGRHARARARRRAGAGHRPQGALPRGPVRRAHRRGLRCRRL